MYFNEKNKNLPKCWSGNSFKIKKNKINIEDLIKCLNKKCFKPTFDIS